ncbi:cytochrome P450 4C1-like [Onthophagus taurus]|uniref:cytochrome P450 4C1-like n=1 Tax=Onthophagus taurus TaxID=166361 RepID=UPI000C2025ED|nr:cytochrome P450 4C1-like [Onthophagus taurus]
MYYIITLGIIALLWMLRNYWKWHKEVVQYIDKIQGPTAYPFIGSLHVFFGTTKYDIFKKIKDITEKYGPFFRTWSNNLAEIHIMQPEHIEIVLKSSKLITKGRGYDFILPWLGDGLLISNGPKWFQRRKLITPAFHFKILEHYMNVFSQKSRRLITVLEKEANNEVFDVYPYITHCALDIICETAMGVSANALENTENNQYVDSLYKTSELIINRLFTPWYHSNLYYLFPEGREFQRHLKILHGFTTKVIADRKKILQENPSNKISSSSNDVLINSKQKLSFLDLLLSANETVPDKDVREEVDTFMFEGHDTTTAAISWSLFLLGNHLDLQEKVYKELKDVLGDKKCPETISELNDLQYLECCIKEALRIYPSVPIIARKLTEEIVIDGYKIPKNVYCSVHIYKVHRNPKIYPNPMKFDPDRFLPENTTSRHPYAYIPFSAGPRNCIGQKFAIYEEKTVLAAILKTYKVIAIDSQDNVNELGELIMRPEEGVRIKLEKR